MDTILAHDCTLSGIRHSYAVVAIRQKSSSGKSKSPRIQVVLTEELCSSLSNLASSQSRTVSNMAKVLIQEGIIRHEEQKPSEVSISTTKNTEKFRSSLEAQKPKRLKGAPQRLRIYRP